VTEDDEFSTTQVLKDVTHAFVRHIPHLLGAALLGTLTWAIHLNAEVQTLKHEVITVREIVPDRTMLASMEQELQDHDARIARLESDWDTAQENAALPPYPPRFRYPVRRKPK
jgi:hypothetical protein